MATLAVNQLQLAPLGAGDLIDRTVRLYRHHFMSLIRASVPPVLVSTMGAVLWEVGSHAARATGSQQRLLVYVLLGLVGFGFWVAGLMSQLIVMGGATHNLVMHLLWAEPVTARLVYRGVRARFWGLFGASVIMVVCIVFAALVALVLWYLLLVASGMVLVVLAQAKLTWLLALAGLIIFTTTTLVVLTLFFLIVGRIAYVPQVMMVEAKGVFAAFGRSARLARGNVRRLMTMFLFTSFATYAALMLLLIPLGWMGHLYGVNLLELDASRWPVWYAIGYRVVWQLSTILLAPVWMMGLSLLYVDERVRHEGYDIELLAAQRLGEIPALPYGIDVPLAPAIAEAAPHAETAAGNTDAGRSHSVLGLPD